MSTPVPGEHVLTSKSSITMPRDSAKSEPFRQRRVSEGERSGVKKCLGSHSSNPEVLAL